MNGTAAFHPSTFSLHNTQWPGLCACALLPPCRPLLNTPRRRRTAPPRSNMRPYLPGSWASMVLLSTARSLRPLSSLTGGFCTHYGSTGVSSAVQTHRTHVTAPPANQGKATRHVMTSKGEGGLTLCLLGSRLLRGMGVIAAPWWDCNVPPWSWIWTLSANKHSIWNVYWTIHCMMTLIPRHGVITSDS